MTTSTLTLADFLLARIAEDEAVARDLIARDVFAPTQGPNMRRLEEAEEVAALTIGEGRVLAECEAKRAILEVRAAVDADARTMFLSDPETAASARATRAGLDVVIKLLALPYADHPDFRPEWRA